MSAIPPDEILPCGCILRCSIEHEVKTLTVIPCHESCLSFQNLLGIAKEEELLVEKKILT